MPNHHIPNIFSCSIPHEPAVLGGLAINYVGKVGISANTISQASGVCTPDLLNSFHTVIK